MPIMVMTINSSIIVKPPRTRGLVTMMLSHHSIIGRTFASSKPRNRVLDSDA